MGRHAVLAIAIVSVLLGSLACSATAGMKPVRDEDPQVACPGGRLAWNLQIQDQRAELRDSQKLIDLVRSSLSQSFPGCRWVTDPAAGTLGVEIHHFSARLDGSIWDGGVDWTVSARDAGGRSLTEFDVTFEASRPNYRNVDNERALLQEVFEQAIKKTVLGLQSLSSSP
jgi:hypothetical protein